MIQTAVVFIDDTFETSRVNCFLRDLHKSLNDKIDNLVIYAFEETHIDISKINLDASFIRELQPIVHIIDLPTTHRVTWDIISNTFVRNVIEDRNSVIHLNSVCKSQMLHATLLLSYYLGFIPKPSTIWAANETYGDTRFYQINLPIKVAIPAYTHNQIKKDYKALYDKSCLESPKLIEALDIIATSCQIPDINLLILGEKGTGKSRIVEELIGRMKNKIVTTVVCGSLSRELAMSQLFGYEKGAYTGASKNQPGLVQEAENGILFFDEVQDLPKEVQRMLVRFLQDRDHRYRPVGSVKEYVSNTELVFASHLTLNELRNMLDDDLFDRISLITVEIPPLRLLRADLFTLWHSVWKEHNVIPDLLEAPENEIIKKYLLTNQLEGNLRNLVALCKTIAIFYIQTKDVIKSCELAIYLQSIKTSVAPADMNQSMSDSIYSIDFSKDFKTLTRDFKKCVIERLSKYPFTNQQIAEKLRIDEKTVRNILSGNFS